MRQEKSWKTPFTVFVNLIVWGCPDNTANVPEKSILRLPKAENTRQRKSAAHSAGGEGYERIEEISFEAYNESACLIEAVERLKERTGYYPKCVLADQIYRTRENRHYCKEH